MPSDRVERVPNPRAERAGRADQKVVSKQPSIPKLKQLKNGHYRVTENWRLQLDGRTWVIQKGYTSNGITAPDYIKSNLGDSVDSRDTWAAVYHDWLFTQPGIGRDEADRLYHKLMLAYGVPSFKAQLMYNTVSAYSRAKLR
ncbi:MAG: DUF1353 domain-containing protein [Akkermansiaceae bacterium]